MTDWPDFMTRRWFAVALSNEVRRKPVRRRLLGRPVVLARLDGRKIQGFEDCCPHRRAPLSDGCIVDQRLQCAYHGWQFDTHGRLRVLPGMAEDAPVPHFRLTPVGVVENDGLIWVRLAPDARATLPEHLRRMAPGTCKFRWHSLWQGDIVDVLENVLDPLHTHFIHPGLVRKGSVRRKTRVTFAPTGHGFVVDYAGQGSQSGLIYRLFESPRSMERAHFLAPGSVQLEYGYQNGRHVRISMHFSPVTPTETRLVATLHMEGCRVPAWAIRLLVWPFIRHVARQDQRILARQAVNTRSFPHHRDAIAPQDMVRRGLRVTWSDTGTTACGRSIELWL